MRNLGFIWRVLLLIALFAVVGVWTAHWILAREAARGVPEYQVRLAAYMGGLFAGGVVATLVGVSLLLRNAAIARRNAHR